MHRLQRLFASQSRPFIIYVTLLLALLGGARWYQGWFKQRTLAQVAASVREVVTDPAEIAKIKMERTALEFQLPNLRHEYPLLTNAVLADDWAAAAVLCQVEPAVAASWRAYLNQVSPLVQEKDPSLGPFLALQQGYAVEVERLAKEVFLRDKPALLLELRDKKFAPLFRYDAYVADGSRFDGLARSLADEDTRAARKAYEEALAAAAVKVNPQLSEYARARLKFALKSDDLRSRLQHLSEQLGDLAASPSSVVQPDWRSAVSSSPVSLLRQASFESYVPQEKDFLGILLATALVGIIITQPIEMRDRRWLKTGASVVLVYLGLLVLRIPVSQAAANRGTNVFAFLAFLVPAALLAAIWASSFTSLLSNLLLQFIDPAGLDETEDSRLRPAYEAARQGQYRLALKLVKPKLLLDPWHYEALVLQVRLQRQLNRKWRARWTLAKLLRNRHLTADQRETAKYLRHNLGCKNDPCWSLAKREVPRQQFKELFHY